MNADLKWLRVQAVSGAVFSLFLFVHLLNQALAMAGASAYDDAQGSARRVYQAPVLELVLVGAPLLVHVVSALVQLSRRPKASAPVSWRVRVHRYSGRFLLLVIVGHVVATRGASLGYGTFPGFHGVAFTFQWAPTFFWPYYTALALCGWYHLVHGLSTAGAVLQWPGVSVLQRRRVFVSVVGIGALALGFGVLSLGGLLVDVGDPASSTYARLVLRLAGSRLPW
jgi:succinate dehydrogenase/fumarate reductase cytochrome b subunit